MRANLVLTKTFSTDTDYTPGWRGKVLHLSYPGVFQTTEKQEDVDLTPVVATGTGTSLTLNHLTVVPFALENYVEAISQPGVLDRYITSATIAVAESIESQLYTDVVANFTGGPLGTATTDVDAALVRSTKQALDDARAPSSDRYFVLSSKDATALLADTDLQSFFAFAAAQSGIRQGQIGELFGQSCVMSQLTPYNSGTSTTTLAAYHRDAGLVATRPLPTPTASAGVQQASAVDPQSGLSITVQASFAINSMALRVNVAVLWGAISARPELGISVIS